MKQIILGPASYHVSSSGLCSGKLIFRFALYGCAVWWLDRVVGGSTLAEAAVWSLALLVGAVLALVTWED
jgi:hypothetical protein